MKIACSTSFHKDHLEEALARIAGMGFQYVDLIGIKGWNHLMPADLLDHYEQVVERLAGLLEKNRLTPISMNIGLEPRLCDRGDEAANTSRLELTRAFCRLMNHFDIPVAGYYPGYRVEDRPWEEVLADTATTIREIQGVTREFGVSMGPELHWATPFENIPQCKRLLEAVPDLTIQYDPSHFIMQNLPVEETLPFLQRAHHLHFRGTANEKMQCPASEGCTHFAWVLAEAKKAGYAGHCSIEYLPKGDFDVEKEIVATKEKLETLMER